MPKCNQNTQILTMNQISFYHKTAAIVKQTSSHHGAHAEGTDLFIPLPVVNAMICMSSENSEHPDFEDCPW